MSRLNQVVAVSDGGAYPADVILPDAEEKPDMAPVVEESQA
jgi:hypothetical protein